ncbi:hypothetical protein [Ascidiimonas sp. W6]|uniref:hypothetical protein n=1 Tax=Ascidiimonas meishanensis TaxID=3128903 RepID=UPI0030ECA93D
MKKIFALCLLIATITSCSLDDGANFHFEAIPVTGATLPESFELNESYNIKVSYLRPNDCYFFEGFDYLRTGENERSVTLVTSVFDRTTCNEINQEVEVSFDFVVLNTGIYTFRFWRGNDANGDPDYLVIEVPVIEE